ncbi:MAG: heat-inducible transcriptional repressor HrcA [Thomasclavelia sp.]|nr:heat-inducible transcriptional repressor HrcA [Thomasclavelia sp.]
MLSARQLLIFQCIVKEFINTAEPVGSKTLMTKYQLPYSSATIRNEMSALENAGYLQKTHTSSGRVPSKDGYRFYVEHLDKVDISDDVKTQVATIFNDRHRDLNDIVHESCNILSELTNLTTVALGDDNGEECFQRITIVPIDEQKVTAIIITSKGHVENKNFQLADDIEMEDLLNCVNCINDMIEGTPMSEVAYRLEHDVKPNLTYKVQKHEVLFNAFMDAFMKFANSNIYFSGKEHMLYQPEYNDVEKLRRIVSAFDNFNLWKSLEPGDQKDDDRITLRIGNESPIENVEDVSVVSASFKTGEKSKGSISVIGPTRMPYEKVVSLVEFISKNIEKAFLDDEEKDDEDSR